MATPTTEPAVPGAFGAKPAPPAVAITIAIQSAARIGSLFVFTLPIGSVNFFRRTFFCRHTISLTGPFAQVDQFTAFTAEWTIRIACVFDFFFARWALHGRVSVLRPSPGAVAPPSPRGRG